MRMCKNFFGYIALIAIFFSCKKEISRENGSLPPVIDSKWEFKESGEAYKGPMDTAYAITHSGGEELSLSGSSADGTHRLILRLLGSEIAIGTYKNPFVLFQYTADGAAVFQNIPSNTDEFSVTITSIDSLMVTGTFSGKVVDGLGNAKTIEDGKFTAAMADSTGPPPVEETGLLTVWSKQLCSGGGNIQVTVNGQSAAITQALASEPTCGAQGTVSFTLPVGSYTVKAVCDQDSIMYSVQIEPANCTLLQIDFNNVPVFTDYFPIPPPNASFWTYQDASGTLPNNTVTIQPNEILDGREYSTFAGSNGDINYYRKEPNVYYQYMKFDFEGIVSDISAIEVIFLKDNAAIGEYWESPEFNVTYSGLPVRVKVRSTIQDKDFGATIGGKNYNDLIEVKTELMVALPTQPFQAASEFTTVYGKGVGIVYQQDLNRQTEWLINDYNIIP